MYLNGEQHYIMLFGVRWMGTKGGKNMVQAHFFCSTEVLFDLLRGMNAFFVLPLCRWMTRREKNTWANGKFQDTKKKNDFNRFLMIVENCFVLCCCFLFAFSFVRSWVWCILIRRIVCSIDFFFISFAFYLMKMILCDDTIMWNWPQYAFLLWFATSKSKFATDSLEPPAHPCLTHIFWTVHAVWT